MRKIFLFAACLVASMGLNAQDEKVAIASASATSAHSGHDAAKAIDGSTETIWHSNWDQIPEFPVSFTITLTKDSHVDFVRYIPRQDGSVNGCWKKVTVAYNTTGNAGFKEIGTYVLNGDKGTYDIPLGQNGVNCSQIKFTIYPGASDVEKKLASAAEIEAYAYKTDANEEALGSYFKDALYTELKDDVSSSEGIDNPQVKALVESMLLDKDDYKKFRVAEYRPHMTLATAQKRMGNKNPYSKYENPTGVYLNKNQTYWVAASGIENDVVNLTIKNWVTDESKSSYSLHNGLNCIDATTEGNAFITYYTDNAEAKNVKVHFINAPVRGYWDQQTMTNDDWKALLQGKVADDNTILMVQSEHVQLAYPISAWLAYCPEKVTELMELYEQVQWAQRDIMGLEKYSKTVENRQFFYATTDGFMAAGDEGAYCNVNSLDKIMTPDVKVFDFWGVGHEWGHNNQIPGFHWSGCGETTNNIYASWAQLHAQINNEVTPLNLRLEDEVTGINDYTKMRGGRMQVYFEEGLRKGIAWQLQDGPDYHGAAPNTKEVDEYDANGNKTGKKVPANSRNYDHFVKLAPFWQLNLWGDMAEKCPDIIPAVIESIRTTANYTSTYNTNGKQQVNWMKLACDAAQKDLLPFFEKAGMLRPINAYIEDYAAGWNIITEGMINELKQYVKDKGYAQVNEEINYINGHNYLTYKEKKTLVVPATLGQGCTQDGDKVKVLHSEVQNAVAFETYNAKDEIIRITMYGLGSDANHSYTQVLYPKNDTEKSAYIMAVGYDGTRKMIYGSSTDVLSLETIVNTECYTISTQNRGSWYAEDERLNGTVEMGVDYNIEDANQQFAFLKSGRGNYYLYSVGKNKFVKVSGNHTSLTDTPEQAVKFLESTGAGKANYPWVVAFVDKSGEKQIAVSTGYSPDVITFYNDKGDEGNMVRIKIAGDFDPAAALAKIKAYEESAKYNELQGLISKYQAEINNADKGVGYLTTVAAAKIQTAVTEAKKVTSDKTDEEIQAAIDALNASFKDVEIVLPAAGTYYKMTNHTAENSVMYVDGDNGLKHTAAALNDGSDVFQFIPTTGGYYLYNVARGTYLSTANVHGGGQNFSEATSVEDAIVITVASFNDGSVPQVSLIPANGATLHADTNYGTVVGWTAGSDSKSAWFIETTSAPTYTLSVTDAGWASLVLGFNATIPSGVKAYIVSGVAEDKAKLVQVSGTVLPANTPVLIEAAKGDYEFAHTTTSATVAGNMLLGKPYNTYLQTVAGTTNYVLSNNNGVVALYKKTVYDADRSDDDDVKDAEGEVTEAKNDHIRFAANKAYLPVAGSAKAISLDRGEGTTGIKDAELAIDNVVIYDLTGRRVEKMEKGIYIVNGKKVVIK